MDPDFRHPSAPIYEARIKRFQIEVDVEERRSGRLSNWRLGVFLLAVAASVAARYMPVGFVGSGALYLVGALSIAGFVILVMVHARVSARIESALRFRRLNTQALSRLARRWDGFPVPAAPRAAGGLALSVDLDLFGEGSLFHLLCTAQTKGGRAELAAWLTSPAGHQVAAGRHGAGAELAPMIDWRQKVAAAGMDLDKPDVGSAGEIAWARGEPRLTNRPWLVWLSRLLPAAFLLLAVFHATGLVRFPWWIFPIIGNFVLIRICGRRLKETLENVRREELAVKAYSTIFGLIDPLSPESPWLKQRASELEGAHTAVEKLCTIATGAAAKGSLVYPLLNGFLAWDFRVAVSLEQWRERHAEKVDGWFNALAQIEAIASLANLHHDEPGWRFPEFVDEKVFDATQLGHPLIGATTRVTNDVSIGPPGKFLFVTGSNMSGKSTLLRSIGLNIVLAEAGAPVCAQSLRLPPLRLATSLRVQDSLTEGLSFFMAELQRIKEVVLMADADAAGGTLLYLFDEILRGTNNVERAIIVHRLLRHLLTRDAIGAMTTHDMGLAETEGIWEAAVPVHFRETFAESPAGTRMTFDYRLRPGLATTTNALKLLQMIDLKLAADDEPD